MTALVDSNVLLDIFTVDPKWFLWSSQTLAKHAEYSILAVNPIIYAEVSIHFSTIEALQEALPEGAFKRLQLPWEASFLAGRCFLNYKKKGGERRSPLPDFYIGAHAAIENLLLITRDAHRYKTYFPKLKMVVPLF